MNKNDKKKKKINKNVNMTPEEKNVWAINYQKEIDEFFEIFERYNQTYQYMHSKNVYIKKYYSEIVDLFKEEAHYLIKNKDQKILSFIQKKKYQDDLEKRLIMKKNSIEWKKNKYHNDENYRQDCLKRNRLRYEKIKQQKIMI